MMQAAAGEGPRQTMEQTENMQDRLKENPLESLELDDLDEHVKALFAREFQDKKSVTEEELIIGARLARSNYGNHEQDPTDDGSEAEPKPFTPSIDTVKYVLNPHDWKALSIQKSKMFWKEPKALLVTLSICCLAPWVQGWNQAANGNLGWPQAFGVTMEIKKSGADIWEFGTVNAVLWFAAMIGPLVFNATPILGRRGSVFIAAIFSLVGSIGASYSQNWRQLLGWRIVLGIGIGAKASIVPIWESEILPPAKRGRVLVSWQVFVAVGLLTGNGAVYYFQDARKEWRYQILTGALPALILLTLVFIGCESPRWLIIHEQYVTAFDTLVELRKERLLAAEEFCYTYFQIQAERSSARKLKELNFSNYQPPILYTERLKQMITHVRNRRALFATVIVMMTQHLAGINIFAILGTRFYEATNMDAQQVDASIKQRNNVKLGLLFSAATVIASASAYFLVEPLPVDASLDDLYPQNGNSHPFPGIKRQKMQQNRLRELQRLLRGRRRLLLISLASGTAMLGGLTGVLSIPADDPTKDKARSAGIAAFVFFLAFCYSPGVGAVPFLYAAEIWPNEARDIGMSVGVFVNFLGAGLLTLVVPQALAWSDVRLFAIVTGLSSFGFLLVYFFVPCTNKAVSLEEMSAIFEKSLFRHARNHAMAAIPFRTSKVRQGKSSFSYYEPTIQPQQSYHSFPAPSQEPLPRPVMTPYTPYGYAPVQIFQGAPPVPQPYYHVQDPTQFSPSQVSPNQHHNSQGPSFSDSRFHHSSSQQSYSAYY